MHHFIQRGTIMFRVLSKLSATCTKQSTQRHQRSFMIHHYRHLTSWTKTDLPIMPRVAFAHKQINALVTKHMKTLSDDLFREFKDILHTIKQVNWHHYNNDNLSLNAAREAKEKIQKLMELEHKLPESLHKELSHSTAFNDLRDVIDCLDDRCGITLILRKT
jgi:hypothetical protein